MARIDVLMPQMGESIAEGTVSKWLKKIGDPVKRDEPLLEISTDKVDAEIPAPPAAASAPPASKPEPPKPAPPPPPPPPPAAAAASVGERPRPPATAPSRQGGDGAETAEERLRKKSTPLVRKIAAEHQVDISTIPGTGFAGRVTKQDILGFIERGVAAPRPAAATSIGPIAHPVVEPWPGDRVEPFSKIRKITADHMIMSRRVSAHVT